MFKISVILNYFILISLMFTGITNAMNDTMTVKPSTASSEQYTNRSIEADAYWMMSQDAMLQGPYP